jgi:hypothetical protein
MRIRSGVATFLLVFITLPDAIAAESALSPADAVCLGCHAIEGLEKKLPSGESLSLNVSGQVFERSVHRVIGCAGCHGYIDLGSHPATSTEIRSLREYSIARAEGCRLCHDAAFKEYEGSLHFARIREGNALAPVCTGCHGSHSVSPRTAYETCVRCHSAALGAHGKWLPNAGLHHEVVSCAACHAPAAPRMLDLRLYDSKKKQWVTEKEDSPVFEQLASSADADSNGLDAVELQNLLRDINRHAATPMILRGRVELRSNVEAHRLTGKAEAIRACDNCHRYGAEPFENVTVSMTGPDGRPLRYPAQKEILSSAQAVQSLPEFYAIGGTRSTFLDILFALALLGGIGIPIGHTTMKWLFRKYRAGRERTGGEDDSR